MAEHTLDDTISHIHVHQLVDGSAAGPLVAMATRFGVAEGWANARLIAAAPEMLEALLWCANLLKQIAERDYPLGTVETRTFNSERAARAAIAKATK
jgi:hypothetical protein